MVLILEAAITFFLFKFQRQQCACNGPLESLLITQKMHLYRHLRADFLADYLTFQVFERGLESEPVGGEIFFGVGGGLTNSK